MPATPYGFLVPDHTANPISSRGLAPRGDGFCGVMPDRRAVLCRGQRSGRVVSAVSRSDNAAVVHAFCRAPRSDNAAVVQGFCRAPRSGNVAVVQCLAEPRGGATPLWFNMQFAPAAASTLTELM